MKLPAGEIRHLCRIQAAGVDDAKLLSQLAMRSKAYWGYDEEFLNQCRGELNYSADQILAPQHDFQVCLFDYQVIAFYALERIDDELVELEALFVGQSTLVRALAE
ncbi:MAG: hypothetical protein O3A13_15395 [Proteobacteria bacterium]|nr:hypothetical protein [Pseudomonadota bacterium]MDA0995002.1 hypothetical protein [Pseudomonadota bacterium]